MSKMVWHILTNSNICSNYIPVYPRIDQKSVVPPMHLYFHIDYFP